MKTNRLYSTIYIGLCAALIAVCSQIQIPGPVPFTLQTFAVFLAFTCESLLINLHELVGAAADAQRLGRFEHVLAVAALDARDQVGAVVVARVHEVDAGLIECDRVGGS